MRCWLPTVLAASLFALAPAFAGEDTLDKPKKDETIESVLTQDKADQLLRQAAFYGPILQYGIELTPSPDPDNEGTYVAEEQVLGHLHVAFRIARYMGTPSFPTSDFQVREGDNGETLEGAHLFPPRGIEPEYLVTTMLRDTYFDSESPEGKRSCGTIYRAIGIVTQQGQVFDVYEDLAVVIGCGEGMKTVRALSGDSDLYQWIGQILNAPMQKTTFQLNP